MGVFTISAFADEIDNMLDEQIRVLKKHKIEYIELRVVDGKNVTLLTLDEARAVKASLDSSGIRVSAIGSPIGKIGITEDFDPHLDLFKHTLDLAGIFEAPYIRMFSFFIPHGRVAEEYRDEVMRRWALFIEVAKGRNIVLLHENEKDIYGDTAKRCLDLINTMNCTYLAATFDPANFVQVGEAVYPEAFNLLKRHIAYVHIKDAKRGSGKVVPAGEGDGMVEIVLQELYSAGWQGFLSLEPHLANSLPGGGPELFAIAYEALAGIIEGKH